MWTAGAGKAGNRETTQEASVSPPGNTREWLRPGWWSGGVTSGLSLGIEPTGVEPTGIAEELCVEYDKGMSQGGFTVCEKP